MSDCVGCLLVHLRNIYFFIDDPYGGNYFLLFHEQPQFSVKYSI